MGSESIDLFMDWVIEKLQAPRLHSTMIIPLLEKYPDFLIEDVYPVAFEIP